MSTAKVCCWPILQVANSWRTTAGLVESGEPANWDNIIRGLDNNAGLGRFAGPGGWNNMDFLAVGARKPCTCPREGLPYAACVKAQRISAICSRDNSEGLAHLAEPGN